MNFRRILSKSSLRSTASSEKNLSPPEEISRLKSEIELFKQTVESLKISVESRDAAIGTLAREKEKLYVELKSVQRTNRNLHQQLVDERDIHSKEKEFLIEEIKRLTHNSSDNANNITRHRADEAQSNSSPNEEIKAKDEVIYNICTKYLKIRSSKQLMKKKLQTVLQQSQKICENVVLLLHENKYLLDNLLSKLVRASYMTPDSKNYINLLKLNANLNYENTQLKVCLSLKDFTDELEQATCDKNNSQIQVTTTKNSRSKESFGTILGKQKNKLLRHRHRPIYSRLYTTKKHEDARKFRSIHKILSPHFRRKKFNSDPCIIERSTEL